MMESDGNIFCGDVVSYSINKTSRDEDNLLYQIYKSKYVRNISMMILNLYNIENAYLHYESTNTKFYEFLVVLCCISLTMNFLQSLLEFKIFILKIPKDSFFIFLHWS